jgi:glucose/arabinose dehydrogenase
MRSHYWRPALLGAAFALQACRFFDPDPRVPGEGGRSALAAATLPTGFRETVIANVGAPTAMAMAPDGRLFVCNQWGSLRVIKGDVLLPGPFLEVATSLNGERGLLGVAIDPDFPSSPYVYVYYTASDPVIHNRISRFTVSSAHPDTVVAGSETALLDLDPLDATNHNGGALHFGPDGKLYVAVGENGYGPHAQDTGSLLGKILRINKDGTIPADNPFYARASGKYRAIWALGLRNPFTFSFQGGTGRMWINDVGEHDWEEIDEGARGANYGWPATEGATSNPAYVPPLYTYANTSYLGTGTECAIVGSDFYAPDAPQFPSDYQGDYFFGDYCAGWIKSMDVPGGTPRDFITGIRNLTGLLVGRDGALYYVEHELGNVVKVTYAASPAPHVSLSPQPATVTEGSPASFRVSATGQAPLAYRWQRNGADIPGADSAAYVLPSAALADSGAVFRCIVSNAQGSDTSAGALLSVTRNRPPVAAIILPDTAYTYRAGDTLRFAGTGADPEDGALPPSSFTWRIDLHHDTHTHPFLPPTPGTGPGYVVIPTTGETSPNVWLRIYLTVADSRGMTNQTWRDVQPQKTQVTLATQPAGLSLNLDGQPVAAPYVFTGVVGMQRALEAPAQNQGGKTWAFVSWSDGGAASHVISTPGAARTYTAVFRDATPNDPPIATITAPPESALYVAGAALAFAGTGFDAQDGTLPDSAFAWRIDFGHRGTVDTGVAHAWGKAAGSYAVPDSGEASDSVFYRIVLTVKDRGGLTQTVAREVRPRKARITLDTRPSGLALTLDGARITAPFVLAGVVGMRHALSAPLGQDALGKSWDFASWSDSGPAAHKIAIPASDAAFTAAYKERATTGILPGNLR